MRVLVVGGRGFLGSRTVAALRRLPDTEVVVGSRRGGEGCVAIDLSDYSSRTAMEGFDFVVNCADSLEVKPDRAAEYCLLQGMTFVEASADAAVIERLRAVAGAVPEPKGAVVLSAGLFPGLSNLLAAKLCEGGVPQRLEIGVRYSPLSQAGRGVCQLMASTMGRDAVRFEAGEEVLDPPLTVGGSLPFSSGERLTMGVGLAESRMLHWSIGAPSTGSFLATVPPLPLAVQRLLTLFLPWGWLRLDAVRWLAVGGMRLLRGGLLRWRSSGRRTPPPTCRLTPKPYASWSGTGGGS